MKIVVSGYYGFNNSGDDALLAAIIENIRTISEKAEITVLSNSPKDTKSVYKTKAVHRYNVFSVLYEIATCDVLLSGGGTLIQDATSTKSLYYYLSIIKLAKLFRKKVMLYANGIGPLTSFKNIETTKNVLNEVDLITLRDENSQKELERIGVNRPEVHLTADPAFLISANEAGDDIMEHYGIPKDKELLCVSVRRSKNNPANFEQILADFCDYAYDKHGLFTVFLPMQQRVDYGIAASIKDKMKNKGVVIGTNYQASSMLSIISKMKICLGMRLHTLIYASSCNVPSIGIVYDPKVNGFLEYMGEENYINTEDLTKEKLCEYLDKVCAEYDSAKSHLKFNVRLMQNKANENTELLKGLLGGGKR
ncbi:MAG: polysaccharide pyruvyl transferase CsaB [Clostridia bacterium]|nr:polysaccharide pyruvyl transferase CsaB [Clostridia bacterium]